MITVTDIFAGTGGSSTGAASVPGGVRRYPGNPAYLVSPDGTVYGPRRFALKGHVLPDGYRRVTIAGRHVLRHLVVAALLYPVVAESAATDYPKGIS